jgi:hypothetical protein
MSTVYYWHLKNKNKVTLPTGREVEVEIPGLRIGTMTTCFLWNTDEKECRATLAAHPYRRIVEDEYGRVLTAWDFARLLPDADDDEHNLVLPSTGGMFYRDGRRVP